VQIEDDQFRPDEASLTEAGKSLRKLAKKKREIWHKWCAIGFQDLDRSYKWTQDQEDSQERRRVLLRDGAAASSTYKLARVVRGLSDEKSGRIRRVPVANKSFTEEVFRTPAEPICKIVLVVPAEDAKLPTLPAYAGPPVDLPISTDLPVDPALPALIGPDVGLSATADTPGDLVTPGTKMPEPTGSVEDVLGLDGPDVNLPAQAGPLVALPAPVGPDVGLPVSAGLAVDLPALPAPTGPGVALSATADTPGDLVTPDVDEPAQPASGGHDVAPPASAGPDVFIPASGGPEMAMPEPVVELPAPAGPPVAQVTPDDLPVEQPAPVDLPEDPGERVEEEAAPGDQTHGGRLRPRKNFYSWDFPDRMRRI
jgi:hypothetical protein